MIEGVTPDVGDLVDMAVPVFVPVIVTEGVTDAVPDLEAVLEGVPVIGCVPVPVPDPVTAGVGIAVWVDVIVGVWLPVSVRVVEAVCVAVAVRVVVVDRVAVTVPVREAIDGVGGALSVLVADGVGWDVPVSVCVPVLDLDPVRLWVRVPVPVAVGVTGDVTDAVMGGVCEFV